MSQKINGLFIGQTKGKKKLEKGIEWKVRLFCRHFFKNLTLTFLRCLQALRLRLSMWGHSLKVLRNPMRSNANFNFRFICAIIYYDTFLSNLIKLDLSFYLRKEIWLTNIYRFQRTPKNWKFFCSKVVVLIFDKTITCFSKYQRFW